MFKFLTIACVSTLALGACDKTGTDTPQNEVVLTPAPAPTTAKAQAPTQDYLNFQKNLELLKILDETLRAEGLPVSNKLVPLVSSVPDIAKLAGLKNIKAAGRLGRVIYRSDGTNYKLVLFNNGQCYLAREHAPERVDPRRAFGDKDCTSFGYWNAGGVKF